MTTRAWMALAMTALVSVGLVGCGSDSPSSPEAAARKFVLALASPDYGRLCELSAPGTDLGDSGCEGAWRDFIEEADVNVDFAPQSARFAVSETDERTKVETRITGVGTFELQYSPVAGSDDAYLISGFSFAD